MWLVNSNGRSERSTYIPNNPHHHHHHHHPPSKSGGIKFFKNGCNEGDGKFLLETGEASNEGMWVSFHSWKRGVLSVMLFLWLNGWSRHISCAILLNDNMGVHISSLGILVPERSWCVSFAIRCQIYWGLTHNVVFYWYPDLISHTQAHTAHSGASRLTHPYKYMFAPSVVCSQQLPLLH